jgi:hypothetical protein
MALPHCDPAAYWRFVGLKKVWLNAVRTSVASRSKCFASLDFPSIAAVRARIAAS